MTRDEGNLFVVKSSNEDTPIEFISHKNGSFTKQFHGPGFNGVRLNSTTYSNAQSAGFSFHYVDTRPGECLIFTKRTLHMTDIRLQMKNLSNTRRTFGFRAYVRDNCEHSHSRSSPPLTPAMTSIWRFATSFSSNWATIVPTTILAFVFILIKVRQKK